MRGIAVLWTVLLSLYAAFAYWHTSFKEPLSPAEITAYQAQLAQSATDAQRFPEAFAAFLTADDGGPFYMFNVMELRKHAKYPEGSSFDVTSGKEADSRYGAGVLPLLLARGSYPVISLNRQVTMLNEYEGSIGAFDKVAIVRRLKSINGHRSKTHWLRHPALPCSRRLALWCQGFYS